MTGLASMSRFPISLKLLLVLLTSTVVFYAGCTPSSDGTGILIVAVEGLKPEDLACSDGDNSDLRGFNFLCQNFLGIQGVVANSTASAANLASLLTGLSPEKHGLRINDQGLTASQVLLSEKLVLRGWRTSLFSGGAPLLRRAHLNQGFETFDESVPLAPKLPFRSFEGSVPPLLSWLKESEKQAQHFALITVSDLMFPEYTTISDKGDTRPRSLDGQIEELDESLFHFFEDLQKRDLWKKWWIVVLGISGRTEPRDRTPAALQVHPTAMLVPVFLHAPSTTTVFKESRVRGVWSFAEIGVFLEEIANDVDTAIRRTPEEQGQFFMEKLRDREAEYASADGCVMSIENNLQCRTAYFDNGAWFAWESPLRLDVPGRKELLMKVQKSSDKQRPESPQKFSFPEVKLKALETCHQDFPGDLPNTAYMRTCPSKAIQSLRQLYQLRQTLLARPDSLRDQKLRFIHEWTQLAAAHQLFSKWDPTRLYNDLNPRSSNEFLTIQRILELPELRDLQREAQRALPAGLLPLAR